MRATSKSFQIGLLAAFVLSAAAAPAFADDAAKSTKKVTTHQKKAEKPKSDSAMGKDTTPTNRNNDYSSGY